MYFQSIFYDYSTVQALFNGGKLDFIIQCHGEAILSDSIVLARPEAVALQGGNQDRLEDDLGNILTQAPLATETEPKKGVAIGGRRHADEPLWAEYLAIVTPDRGRRVEPLPVNDDGAARRDEVASDLLVDGSFLRQ